MEEPRYGGLIDRYWIFDYIIIPLIILSSIIGIIYLIGMFYSCPYVNDVSSCFPYNLPNWVKISIPIISVVIAVILVLVIVTIKPKEQ